MQTTMFHLLWVDSSQRKVAGVANSPTVVAGARTGHYRQMQEALIVGHLM